MSDKIAISTTKTPTIKIYGCGGAGVNIINLLSKFNTEISQICHKLDASTANMTGDNDVLVFGDGKGSGKDQLKNSQELKDTISSIDTYFGGEIPDISIIIASTAGGSGSTIAKHLLTELHKRGSQPVVFFISDTTSRIDNRNTSITLNSCIHTAEQNNIYLPMSLYHNNETSREEVDKRLINDLYLLMRLLTVNTLEVDRNDRINWLNAMSTINADPGIVKLSVYSDANENKNAKFDDVCYDSILKLNLKLDDNKIKSITDIGSMSLFSKEGFNISSEFKFALIGLISPELPELYKILDICKANITKYEKVNQQRNSNKRKITIDPNSTIL